MEIISDAVLFLASRKKSKNPWRGSMIKKIIDDSMEQIETIKIEADSPYLNKITKLRKINSLTLEYRIMRITPNTQPNHSSLNIEKQAHRKFRANDGKFERIEPCGSPGNTQSTSSTQGDLKTSTFHNNLNETTTKSLERNLSCGHCAVLCNVKLLQ